VNVFDKLEEVIERRTFWGLTASGILLQRESDGNICLFMRTNVMQSGTWGIPGGKVDRGEDPKRSAIREFDEELGGLPEGRFSGKKYIFESPLNRGDYIAGDEDGGPDENRYAREGDVFRYFTYLYIVTDDNWRPDLNWEHSRHEWFDYGTIPDNIISLKDEKGNPVKPLDISIRKLVGR